MMLLPDGRDADTGFSSLSPFRSMLLPRLILLSLTPPYI